MKRGFVLSRNLDGIPQVFRVAPHDQIELSALDELFEGEGARRLEHLQPPLRRLAGKNRPRRARGAQHRLFGVSK
jgi:hypothetical protein